MAQDDPVAAVKKRNAETSKEVKSRMDSPSLRQDRRGTGYHYPDADPGTSGDNRTFYYRESYDIRAENAAKKSKPKKSNGGGTAWSGKG